MTLAAALDRIRAGDRLHQQFADGKRVWWFENPHASVADSIVLAMIEAGDLDEAGDSLFGLPLNSQTFNMGDDNANPDQEDG